MVPATYCPGGEEEKEKEKEKKQRLAKQNQTAHL
jgi:hypothetical protein